MATTNPRYTVSIVYHVDIILIVNSKHNIHYAT